MDDQIETIGVRDFSRSISAYIKKAALGVRVFISDRGRVVAELVKPGKRGINDIDPRLEPYLAAGLISVPLNMDKDFSLPRGKPLVETKVKDLIDDSRGE
jgi:antitoxin (DNA-binding transcriptional repressor) of toxin-antitoxin stability system